MFAQNEYFFALADLTHKLDNLAAGIRNLNMSHNLPRAVYYTVR